MEATNEKWMIKGTSKEVLEFLKKEYQQEQDKDVVDEILKKDEESINQRKEKQKKNEYARSWYKKNKKRLNKERRKE